VQATITNASAGAVESLQQEVAPFNVKTLLVEPGYFRTEFLDKDNAKYTHTNLEDYKPLCEAVFSPSRATKGNQTADPVKGIKRVIDIVKGEGYAAGKKFPPWVLPGPDVLAVARKKMEDNLKPLDEWTELSSSTGLWRQRQELSRTALMAEVSSMNHHIFLGQRSAASFTFRSRRSQIRDHILILIPTSAP
jgi:hypothetical protein